MKLILNTEGGSVTIENESVANVRALAEIARDTLGIDFGGATLLVNSEPADLDTPLEDGDEVSTVKPAGRKG